MDIYLIIPYFVFNLSIITMDIKDSKLINLLASFTPREVDEMEKFVNSPFFNTSEQLKEFWKLLKNDYPDFNNLSKEKIFEHFYKSEEYKDKKVRDILSRMLELCREFITHAELQKNSFLKNKLQMKRYTELYLVNHYNSRKKEIEKYLNNKILIDDDYLFEQYTFTELDRNFKEIFEFGNYEEANDKLLKKEYDDFLNRFLKIVVISKSNFVNRFLLRRNWR